MPYSLKVGDTMPAFSALNQDGELIDSNDLLGNPLVIYFYPKDDTPGCTKEACGFRDALESWDSVDALVIGVSPDSVTSHQQFAEKYFLDFELLADEDYSLCRAFDVLRQKAGGAEGEKGVERSTFVIDSKGIICWIERPVRLEEHIERVTEALEEIS